MDKERAKTQAQVRKERFELEALAAKDLAELSLQEIDLVLNEDEVLHHWREEYRHIIKED